MLDFCLVMSVSNSPSLIIPGKGCRLKYELKPKNASQLRRPNQMTSSIVADHSNMSSRVLGKRITCAVTHALHIQQIWATADTKNSWFFNMAVNKADFDLTTNLNGNFWHFLITKSSFCLGKTYAKIIKIP